ncbi:serine hydrolase domain-containing protein [Pseudoalteromonas umbrosa]|uniref:serine hydrolase domain-containing protein n=1 Tax=Pseudoalteromonas umbrosa TaxID=3048489 RepID=UPI0024C2FBC2|nr:serine hydrolase [Pseudoalteromonas sp. B95]MDK1289004.1 serine hydrolase [Pseudoalteromonas sp. B95]
MALFCIKWIKKKQILLIYISVLSVVSVSAIASIPVAPKVTAAESKLAHSELANLEVPYIDFTPETLSDGIRVGNFDHVKADKAMLNKLAMEVSTQKLGKYDSLLLVKGDTLIFESYYLRGRIDNPHPQASVTKAILSLALGRAIALGHLTMADLDKPIVSFFNDLNSEAFSPGAQSITLHQALTMQSGLRIKHELYAALRTKLGQKSTQAQLQALLSSSLPIEPSKQNFNYQSEDPAFVMLVLNKLVPSGAKAFIEQELFNKLGVFNYQWRDEVGGLPIGAYGSALTSRDMVKLGLLVKSGGQWQGEQLIPKKYLAKATNKIVTLNGSDIFFTGDKVKMPSYGYYWWQAEMQIGDKRYLTRSAQGGGGQYIVLIDELDLMIVTTGHEEDEQTMKLIATHLLAVFQSENG